jgi:hypothetical protein
VKIPEGLIVGEDPELDAKRFRRTERGVCLITQPMIDKLLDQPSIHRVPAREIPLINVVEDEQAINGLDAGVTAGELKDEVATSGLKA